MKIRRSVKFNLRPYGKTDKKYQIWMRVTFNNVQKILSTGYHLDLDGAWDSKLMMVASGYVGSDGATASQINVALNNMFNQMDAAFKYFEATELYPTMEQLLKRYDEKMSGITPVKPEPSKKQEKPKEMDFFKAYEEFMSECGEKNAWTEATFEKMEAMRADLASFKKNIKFSSLTQTTLTEFVAYMRDSKKLRTPRKKKGERKDYDQEDLVGLKNSTIEKKLGYLRWFLNWATDKGYNTNLAYKTFRPTLKMTQKKVIYLTKDELARVRNLELSEAQAYLDPIRDVFFFCCFSGLRHSDVNNLRRSDVKGDHIEVTTVKTADSISIELNDITKAILEKYKDTPFKDNKALPNYTNQAMNRDIKELCKLAGIDEEIRITTYKGNVRTDEIHPKHELVGTHTGRRTFIVNALSLGIPPNIVMKWTGHSDYKAMKPYIDIVDSIKATSMTKFNALL